MNIIAKHSYDLREQSGIDSGIGDLGRLSSRLFMPPTEEPKDHWSVLLCEKLSSSSGNEQAWWLSQDLNVTERSELKLSSEW